jgi:hypothetical protein
MTFVRKYLVEVEFSGNYWSPDEFEAVDRFISGGLEDRDAIANWTITEMNHDD